MEKASLSLSELALLVKKSIEESMPTTVWIVAEIAEFREHSNGHCYLELIEKDAVTNQVTARMRAMVWSYAYRMLKPYFETTTGQKLMSGIKILVKGSVEYQEVYGLSFNIKDIDPSFTMGDIERRRRQIITQLEQEGVLEMNKELELPMVLQRIAVISSASAAGYDDFIKQLESGSAKVKYTVKLFNAVMQGEQAESSVIHALERIYNEELSFDMVVIVRGGGASADLFCFDSYEMALNIAQFPLPILTGIGHERDFSVADLVAYKHLKTPTAVAAFILDNNQLFVDAIDDAQKRLLEQTRLIMRNANERYNTAMVRIRPAVNKHLGLQKSYLMRSADKTHYLVESFISKQQLRLNKNVEKLSYVVDSQLKSESVRFNYLSNTLVRSTKQFLIHQAEKLSHLEQIIELNNPQRLLQRGFSITLCNGQLVRSTDQVMGGDELITVLAQGTVLSTVKE